MFWGFLVGVSCLGVCFVGEPFFVEAVLVRLFLMM